MYDANASLAPKRALILAVEMILESREHVLLALKAGVVANADEGQLEDLEDDRFYYEHEEKWDEFRALL